ncbi:MAG TPA: DoxX family protein [Actinomycetota bacterium]|nr:DoxX family protein [Actinomycetota bacterium]
MSAATGVVFLIGRVLFALPFATAAVAFHFARPAQAEGYARSVGFPLPQLAGWPAGLWLLGGVVSVALGIWPDLGCLMIAFWALPTVLWFHRFWQAQGEQRAMQRLLFNRNVMFLGAALALSAVFASLGGAASFTVLDPVIRF